MATNEFYTFPDDEALLSPGEALLNCNGQDITKKNAGKARNRILTIFPAHLGLPLKLTDCVLGNIRNLNSDAPEFVVSTEQGELIFKGKFEYPSTKFLSITCQPSTAKKTGQSALTDVFDKVLVFDEPILQAHSGGLEPTSMFRSSSVSSATSELFGTQSSEAGATSVSVSAYSKHFGMSSVADPIRPATAKRVGTSATKAPSSSSKSRARSSTKTSSSPRKKSRSQKSAGSDSSDQSGSESDGDSSVDTNSQSESDAGDDSASDVEDELGNALLNSDSPVVDRRSSSRRASAAKAVSYRESDEEEEDERSYSSTESGSGATSPTKASRLEIKTIDIADSSSEDEVQIVTKPKATPKKSAEKAKAAPKAKAASASKTTPKASKAPTARKLATNSSTKKTQKGGYFSDVSENEESDAASDASASSSDLSPVRVSGRARSAATKPNSQTHRVADESDSDGESEASVESEESDFLFEDSSSSKKRKASAVKPATKSTKPASAQKSATTAKSNAKKPKVSPTEKESAKKPAAVKKSAAKAPAKRNNRRLDSDDEVITIEDSEDNDSDYED